MRQYRKDAEHSVIHNEHIKWQLIIWCSKYNLVIYILLKDCLQTESYDT